MKVDIGKYRNSGDDRDRKINVKIQDFDLWNLDHTLALIIHPALIRLRDSKSGIPGQFVINEDGTERDHDDAYADWVAALDEMIFAFGEVVNGNEGEEEFWSELPELDFSEHEEDIGKTTRPLRWVSDGKLDEDGHNTYRKRIDDGIELFAKHYLSLWT